jgi:predicted Zn-ribbon and HTH transcriptional regulator
MADSRRAAAEKVMKMLDENDYKPSKTDEVLSLINKSEGDMLQGFAGIIEIRKKLNLLDEKN